jgi:predicted nucleic acid-binding protein
VILVDTSVWVRHLRQGDQHLISLLDEGQVVCHPFIIGELACGSLKNRREILTLLATVPTATIAEHDEVLRLIESRNLYGRGIGWVDAHLIASALLSHAPLWTLDGKLRAVASSLRISY